MATFFSPAMQSDKSMTITVDGFVYEVEFVTHDGISNTAWVSVDGYEELPVPIALVYAALLSDSGRIPAQPFTRLVALA